MRNYVYALVFCLGSSMLVAQSNDTKSSKLVAPPIVKERIPKGSKIYVAPMGGYETFVVAGLMKKEVPVVIVSDREKADYEITGASETQKAGWAKMLVFGSQQSH